MCLVSAHRHTTRKISISGEGRILFYLFMIFVIAYICPNRYHIYTYKCNCIYTRNTLTVVCAAAKKPPQRSVPLMTEVALRAKKNIVKIESERRTMERIC